MLGAVFRGSDSGPPVCSRHLYPGGTHARPGGLSGLGEGGHVVSKMWESDNILSRLASFPQLTCIITPPLCLFVAS